MDLFYIFNDNEKNEEKLSTLPINHLTKLIFCVATFLTTIRLTPPNSNAKPIDYYNLYNYIFSITNMYNLKFA